MSYINNEVRYLIITEHEYIEERLCKMEAACISKKTVGRLKESFKKISGAYNFVIKAGDMIYGVEYFNNRILGNEIQKENPKEKIIKINVEAIGNIEFANAEIKKDYDKWNEANGYIIAKGGI